MSVVLTCEKCGSDDVVARWHEKTDKPWRPSPIDCRDKSEHLHYHCRRCQFEWTGPLTPAGVSGAG